MAIKLYKPTSPGRRGMSALRNEEITKKNDPEKSLLVNKNKTGGRNNLGRLTSRRTGGGHKQKYRIIDFKRDKFNIPAKVASIEYDPNRSANIALLNYVDGEKRYIIAPRGLKVGQELVSGESVETKVGNAMQLKNIPDGTIIHNIELVPGRGAKLARSAGANAQVLGKEGNLILVRLSSKEVRKFHDSAMATIGSVGNSDYNLVKLGKAGRNRWKGNRPIVRGAAKNAVDHPHGGGAGKAPVGHDAPRTPWGKKALGVKTRDKKKKSNKYIVRRRKAK